MRRRLYFVLPDVESAKHTADDLLLARVEDRHMRFLSKRGTVLEPLHEAGYLDKTDAVHGAVVGLTLGGLLGALIGALVVVYPPEGMNPQLVAVLIGMLAGGLGLWLVRAVYFRVRRREGLGLGDVKLAAVAGAWIGWQSLSDVILLAAALALSLALALGLMRGEALSAAARIPFGCFLAPSIWLVWALAALGRL